MKNLIKGALFFALVGTTIVGCEKEDSLNLNDNQDSQTIPSKNNFNTNKSGNNLTSIVDNPNFDHNQRLANMISSIEQDGCNPNLSTMTAVLLTEFDDILPSLNGHVYYDVFTNPEYIRITNFLIEQKIYNDNDVDISGLPVIVQNYYNEAIAKIPSALKAELKQTHLDLENGFINGNNFATQFESRYNSLLSSTNANDKLMVEAYYRVYMDSYQFWFPTSEGGLNNFAEHYNCLQFDGFDNFNNPEMNDNDWPNGATNPAWMDDDILGTIGALACGGGWGSLIAGACASAA